MHSVTAILFRLGLPSFDTLMHNYQYSVPYSFCEQYTIIFNAAVVYLRMMC